MQQYKSLNLDWKILVLYFGLGLSIFFIRSFSLFLIFCLLGGYVKYLRIKTRLPLIFEPIFFFTVLIAKSYPFYYVLIFILTANLIPEIMNLDFDMFSVIWVMQLIFYSLIAVFLNLPIVQIGMILSFLDIIVSTLIHFFLGDSPDMFSIAPVSFLAFNLIYFVSLGTIIMGLLA